MKRKLTVFMPVYNRENYLRDSIESILNQNLSDFEFLIIDDGSTDNSVKIIESYQDNRIRLLKNKINKGIAFTRNRGLEESNGKYILTLDSDDIALQGRLKKQLEFIDSKPDAMSAFSGYIASYPNGECKEYDIIEDNNKLRAMMIFKNCVVNGSSIINRELVMKNKIRYDEAFFYGEDYSFFVECLKYGNIYGQNEKLTLFNYSSEGSISGNAGNRREEITKKIMFNIRKTYLENNQIILNEDQILTICKSTAQPTLVSFKDLNNLIDTLEFIKEKNVVFDHSILNKVLQDITNEILGYSQKISYIKKIGIFKKNKPSFIKVEIGRYKLLKYHIKFQIINNLKNVKERVFFKLRG
ncbi:glycosyltransferase family A protein [Peribacillus psychrosaccharolyticus]|uniref:glycosyltransferase family 2 protein n=1 Tax=Peribacillus psychrosaccharolyticus TaxID=1407 RepID=UPI003D2A3874